jgi:multiple sugar transport system substrate-binding protein
MEKKKLNRRDFLRMGAMTAAGAVLAGCGPAATPEVVKEEVEVTRIVEGETVIEEVVVTATPPPKERVVVRFTSYEPEAVYVPIVQEILDERGQNIEFAHDRTIMQGGHAGYSDTLITRLAGGDALDCMHTAVDGLFVLIGHHVIRPLDELLDADTAFKEDVEADIHPALMELMTWQGKQYELPVDWNYGVMYYNTKLFQENGVDAPAWDWSWSDFLEACQAVADVQGTEEDVYGYCLWPEVFCMDAWFYNNDTSYITDDWLDSNMLDPKVAETLQFWSDLQYVHNVSPNPTAWNVWQAFPAGVQAMHTCGGWCMTINKNSEFYDFDWQMMPTNGSGQVRAAVGAAGTNMTTLCQHPEEAWEVIKAINSTKWMVNYVTINSGLVSRRSACDTETFRTLPGDAPASMDIWHDNLDYAKRMATPPNYNVLQPLLQRWFAQVFAGEMGVEECVQGCHVELQAEMDKMKEELNL